MQRDYQQGSMLQSNVYIINSFLYYISMQKKLHLIIKGCVQGVWFRHNTKNKAIELDLKGYVKNLPDGNVEAVAEGPEEKLKLFLEWCSQGPKLSKVEDVEFEWEEFNNEFDDFSIRR